MYTWIISDGVMEWPYGKSVHLVCIYAYYMGNHLLSLLTYLSGAFPYSLLSNRDVVHAILNGQRLEKPPNCTEDL